MTDQEYIIAFHNNDQQTISRFYETFRADFFKNITGKFRIYDNNLLADIFQDAVIRLWRNICNQKLTTNNLTSSLASYLWGIGERVALEMIRKNKEICSDLLDNPISKNKSHQLSEDPYFQWLEQVEEPMRLFAKSHNKTECVAEWDRLTKLYQQRQCTKNTNEENEWYSHNDLSVFEYEERYKHIYKIVEQMGKPCAPLLLKFYWDNLPWKQIAEQLGYANADSAKTQKNKCMNKLKIAAAKI